MTIEQKLQRIMDIGEEIHECRNLEWLFESYWYCIKRGHPYTAKDYDQRILENADKAIALWMEFNKIVEDITKGVNDRLLDTIIKESGKHEIKRHRRRKAHGWSFPCTDDGYREIYKKVPLQVSDDNLI